MGTFAGNAEVAAIAKAQALKPTEAEFIGKKGYSRRYRKDGSYTWRYRFKPNLNGVKTKEQQEVESLMRPFHRADTERVAELQSRRERVSVRDGAGQRQYLEPDKVDETAQRNGWKHDWRGSGGMIRPEMPDGYRPRWVRKDGEWIDTEPVAKGD